MKGKPPLGMPEGSVRAILACLLVVGALVGALTRRLSFSQASALAGPALGLYFGQYMTPGGWSGPHDNEDDTAD